MSIPKEPPRERYHAHLVRGALVNVVGLVAKLMYPLFFVFVAWLFGPEVLGLYLLATFIGEIGSKLVSSGYVDGTTIYGSHHVDGAQSDQGEATHLHQVLANAYVFTLALGALIVAAALLGADALVDAFYSEHPQLVRALQLYALSIPLLVFAEVSVAATKARMRMEYDAAILGFALPFGLLGFTLLAWALDWGLAGLMLAHVCTHALLALMGAWAVHRHFEWRAVLGAMRRLRVHRALHRFAWPQNLNMTFSRYATRLDVLMLGAFGYAATDLAFYGTAALVTSQLRVVKLVFSSALGPVIARHHKAREKEAFEAVLGRVSRWTTTIIVPIVLMVTVLRDDVLTLVDASFTGDTTYVVVLLTIPFVSCAYGRVGNCITFTGHSNWTLVNAIMMAGVNTVLNYVLIPPYGMMGAACASAIASGCVATAQLVELRFLEGTALRFRYVFKPHVGLALGAIVLALLWDPATLPSLGLRIGAALAAGVGYIALMRALGLEELVVLQRRLFKASAS